MFGRSGAAARSAVVMKVLRGAPPGDERELPPASRRAAGLQSGDGIVEEHDAETRDDQRRSLRARRRGSGHRPDEACRHAFRSARARAAAIIGSECRCRSVALRAEQPRDGERGGAGAAADVEHPPADPARPIRRAASSNGMNTLSSTSCASTQARRCRGRSRAPPARIGLGSFVIERLLLLALRASTRTVPVQVDLRSSG